MTTTNTTNTTTNGNAPLPGVIRPDDLTAWVDRTVDLLGEIMAEENAPIPPRVSGDEAKAIERRQRLGASGAVQCYGVGDPHKHGPPLRVFVGHFTASTSFRGVCFAVRIASGPQILQTARLSDEGGAQ